MATSAGTFSLSARGSQVQPRRSRHNKVLQEVEQPGFGFVEARIVLAYLTDKLYLCIVA